MRWKSKEQETPLQHRGARDVSAPGGDEHPLGSDLRLIRIEIALVVQGRWPRGGVVYWVGWGDIPHVDDMPVVAVRVVNVSCSETEIWSRLTRSKKFPASSDGI